ncbi:MAG: WD40 repeat domain-containing serine/threonine protein kinase [Gemmataceae bacterium]
MIDREAVPLAARLRLIELGDQLEDRWRAGERLDPEELTAGEPEEFRPFLLRELQELQRELSESPADTPRDPVTRRIEPVRPGQTIGGYELLEEIGRGGMGVVFRARQVKLGGRIVALKCIRPDFLDGVPARKRDEAVQRFRAEAAAAAALTHDHLVTVHEVDEDAGVLFYSMRYIDGGSLADLLRDGPLSGDRAAALLEPVARAVQVAHDHGILHRDLKPGNILLDRAGRPFVADFGLAKQLEPLRAEATQSRAELGTPEYMSPEQARGDTAIDARADVYGLGATLYQMLTGRPPFRANTPVGTLYRVLHDRPVPPRRLNPAAAHELEQICLKCLAKFPRQRFASAAALADELRRFRDGRPTNTRFHLARRRFLRAAVWVGPAVTLAIGAAATQPWFSAREIGTGDGERPPEPAKVGASFHTGGARDPGHELALMRDGTLVGFGGDRRLRRWDLATGKLLQESPPLDVAELFEAALSGDGHRLVVKDQGGDDPKIRIFDTTTRQVIDTVPAHGISRFVFEPRTIAISSDGRRVAHGGQLADKPDSAAEVRLWQDGKQSKDPVWRDHRLFNVQFSPDGTQLAITGIFEPKVKGGAVDLMVDVYQLPAAGPPKPLWHKALIDESPLGLAWSPDGTILVGGDQGGLTRFPDGAHRKWKKASETIPNFHVSRIEFDHTGDYFTCYGFELIPGRIKGTRWLAVFETKNLRLIREWPIDPPVTGPALFSSARTLIYGTKDGLRTLEW